MLALAGCGEEPAEVVGNHDLHGGPLVSIGKPVDPVRVKEPPRGSRELRVADVGRRPRGSWQGIYLVQPRDRSRDACLMVTSGGEDVYEADTFCDVLARGAVAAFVGEPTGQGAGLTPSPTMLSGVAGPGVRSVTIDGPGGRQRLPLSAHGAFAVAYAWPARGTVRLTWEADGRSRSRSFRLPPSDRQLWARQHRGRRAGAVFDDEVGKPITELSRDQVHRRFGRPAAVRGACEFYEVVGYPGENWEFCFAPNGRMRSARGNTQPPPRG